MDSEQLYLGEFYSGTIFINIWSIVNSVWGNASFGSRVFGGPEIGPTRRFTLLTHSGPPTTPQMSGWWASQIGPRNHFWGIFNGFARKYDELRVHAVCGHDAWMSDGSPRGENRPPRSYNYQ